MTDASPDRAAERVARESYGRLLAYLAARTRDVAGGEDALAEAFATALETWPREGVPDNPEAWLLTVARRRQTDAIRRSTTRRHGEAHLSLIQDELDDLAMSHDAIPDRRLALMFACAHPQIDPAMRAPLILQTILGLTAADIGAAFLVPPATMGQRLVRAKTRIGELGIGFEIPDILALPERLDGVLEAIYAAYAKGWSDLADEGSALATEAIWLGRLVVALAPDAPEPKGMLALMYYSHARRAARRDSAGAYVPLEAQDTALWDQDAIAMAEALLRDASTAGPTGRCQIEAAIQSAHVARRLSGQDNWPVIVQLYDILLAMTGSPVVQLNRAAALAQAKDPVVALASMENLATDKRMAEYQPYWALRGHLLAQIGDTAGAHDALTLAMGLSMDPAIRDWLGAQRSRLVSLN
ncbi:RNA polymerase sigma factor [Devosia sediminis]|uniref:RNA polymerase subunit sigma-70 n=1 Tax=Devosia sediminis TaxID=2798801 RepID=A0A934MJU2_9HYPH|nr:DUF6596 domain-containing protein [Devosia sediminis]MBJ3783435.1 RNA polymerase subunit sigma-70 [Devosia sediminis]